ncbi:ATP-binding protein [Fulvivirgaceae bacterium BMA10]|uniref:histidine kinase n=1 Tax=Splendidivirga corallicola TaxID=3051826 RepID=A0ABT8KWZ6_9BACT|nr:ATP-binding protein [Fulvivirgaceae bacterium BMA10]
MNLDQRKSSYLNSRVQFVLIDEKGKAKESCNTLFEISIFGSNLYKSIPFLESMEPVLKGLQEEELSFPCIELEVRDELKYCDFIFKGVKDSKETDLLWIIQDFTDHYQTLTALQQQRNENEIQAEFMAIEQKNILLEKELLEYKNQELERLQRFKSKFFSNLSHEIRTPVNSIIGLSHLLGSDQDNQKRLEYIKTLDATANHLVAIVNDVLDLSKIEAGKISLEITNFEIGNIIQTVASSFSMVRRSKFVSILCDIDKSVPKILRGDKTKLTQILFNVVGNAVKFTERGTINISVGLVKSLKNACEIFIEIKDTGIGISSEKLRLIFEPFEQLIFSNEYKGTGLGLSIVKQLVDLQKGQISVTSEEGKGSTFKIILPYEIPSIVKVIEPKENTDQSKIRILLGDDDPTTLAVISGFLDKRNCLVDVASDGTEVLRKLNEQLYDQLILDYHMPKMNGYETALQVRNTLKNSNQSVPILLSTGSTDDRTIALIKKIEGVSVLKKPFLPEDLMLNINQVSEPLRTKMTTKENISLKIDLSYLKEITDNDKSRMKDIIDLFRENTPIYIKKMRGNLQNMQLHELNEIVHKAKAGFRYFGLKEVERFMSDFEINISHKENIDQYAEILDKIEDIAKLVMMDLLSIKESL